MYCFKIISLKQVLVVLVLVLIFVALFIHYSMFSDMIHCITWTIYIQYVYTTYIYIHKFFLYTTKI